MAEKKVSQAQREATDRYIAKLDEIKIRIPKGEKDRIKAFADSCGESVNGFIYRAILEAMQRGRAAEVVDDSGNRSPEKKED